MVLTGTKMLLSSSILLEISGFIVILQNRPTDGMVLVLFGMTFCLFLVFSDSRVPAEVDPDPREVMGQLLNQLFADQPAEEVRPLRWRRPRRQKATEPE